MSDLKTGIKEFEGEKQGFMLSDQGNVKTEEKEVSQAGDKKSLKAKFNAWYSNLSKGQRVLFWIAISVSSIFLLSLISVIFKIDAYLFPSSIAGTVYDTTSKGVQGVTLCVQEQCTVTEINGSYVIGNLKYGQEKVVVSDPDYRKQEIDIVLKRGRNALDITVEPAGYGSVVGSVDLSYKQDEEFKILFDENEVELDEEGTFRVENIPIGDYKVKVVSVYFKDDKYDVTVSEDENELEKIKLTEAGDVQAKVVDFVSLKALESVIVTNLGNEKKTNEKGEFTIRDLEIDEEVTLRFLKEGYNEKEYSIAVEQGMKDIGKVKLVRSGKVVYVSNRLGNSNVYVSNYDGSDEKLLSDNNGDSYAPYLSDDQQTVYFVSTREQIKNEFNEQSFVLQVYSTSVNGGSINKISETNYEDNKGELGSYDFRSMKRAFRLGYWESDSGNNELHVSDISGANSNVIFDLNDNFLHTIKIASSGEFLTYNLSVSEDEATEEGIYYASIDGSEKRLIYATGETTAYPLDISPNNRLVLVKMWDLSGNKWDLWVFGLFDDTSVRITNTSTEEIQSRFTPDGNYISYYSTRDGRSDVYKVGIDGHGETKVTEDGEVDDYFWGENGLLFYNSEKVMWVVDSNNVHKAQKVTDSVLGTYYSSSYYCYGGCGY